MLLNKKVKAVSLFLLLFVLCLPAALSIVESVSNIQTCSSFEIKDALRKALFDFFERPNEATLTVNEIKDFLHFYISTNTSQITLDCSGIGPFSGKPYYLMLGTAREITRGIPRCPDGTEYGKCSSTGPRYCYGGRIVERCTICGCGTNSRCDTATNKCISNVANITCNVNQECGADGYIGPYFCMGNNVYRNYTMNACYNPTTVYSSCSKTTSPVLIDKCGLGTYCKEGQNVCQKNVTDLAPSVAISILPKIAAAGQPFNITVIGTDDVGLSMIWWFGVNSTDAALNTAHTYPCSNATFCKNTWAVSTNALGTFNIGANSRDSSYPVLGEPHQASEGAGIAYDTITVTSTPVPLLDIITIKGRWIDYFSNQPIANAVVLNGQTRKTAYTNANGEFAINSTVTSNITFGNANGFGTWPKCYEAAGFGVFRKTDNSLYANLNIFDLIGSARTYAITGPEVNFGDTPFWPSVDIAVDTDIAVQFFVQYNRTGGSFMDSSGNVFYKTSHYLSNAFPLNANARIKLTDSAGKVYYSPSINLPLSHGCAPVKLNFFGNQFSWNATLTEACIDYDNGDNIFAASYAKKGTQAQYDKCGAAGQNYDIIEGVCVNDQLSGVPHSCPTGTKCQNIRYEPAVYANVSACVNATNFTCTDSDYGLNYYLYGTTNGYKAFWDRIDSNIVTEKDSCTTVCSGSVGSGINSSGPCLIEFYCDTNNYAAFNVYQCPYGCLNGACVNQTTASCNKPLKSIYASITNGSYSSTLNSYFKIWAYSNNSLPENKYGYVDYIGWYDSGYDGGGWSIGKMYQSAKVLVLKVRSEAPDFSSPINFPAGTLTLTIDGSSFNINMPAISSVCAKCNHWFVVFADGSVEKWPQTISLDSWINSMLTSCPSGDGTTLSPTGVCLVRDSYTSVPIFSAPDVGVGYAKKAIEGVNTLTGLQSACTNAIYYNITQAYCTKNSNSVQEQVATYDSLGNAQSLTCGAFGCNYRNCSSIATQTCTDSDGGFNIYKSGLTDGRINGIGQYFYDTCVQSNGGACSDPICAAVAEGYCLDGKVTNLLSQCPYGCQNGSCINQTCIDSDNGYDYYKYGEVKDKSGALYKDACTSDLSGVTEFACKTDGYYTSQFHSCVNENKTCSSGACIPAAGNSWCSDPDGFNVNQYSIVSYSVEGTSYNSSDYCVDNDGVVEIKCDNKQKTTEYYSCKAAGKICQNGACVDQTANQTTLTSCKVIDFENPPHLSFHLTWNPDLGAQDSYNYNLDETARQWLKAKGMNITGTPNGIVWGTSMSGTIGTTGVVIGFASPNFIDYQGLSDNEQLLFYFLNNSPKNAQFSLTSVPSNVASINNVASTIVADAFDSAGNLVGTSTKTFTGVTNGAYTPAKMNVTSSAANIAKIALKATQHPYDGVYIEDVTSCT